MQKNASFACMSLLAAGVVDRRRQMAPGEDVHNRICGDKFLSTGRQSYRRISQGFVRIIVMCRALCPACISPLCEPHPVGCDCQTDLL